MSKILFETERLVIREIEISDADFVFELLNTPKWLKNIGDRNVNTLHDAEDYIRNKVIHFYKSNGFGFYLLTLKESLIPIGITGFAKRIYLNYEDIGFAMLPQFEGKGYSYEATKVCLSYGIEKLGFKKVLGITSLDNIPSQKLLEKLGLVYKKNIIEPPSNESLKLYELDITSNNKIW